MSGDAKVNSLYNNLWYTFLYGKTYDRYATYELGYSLAVGTLVYDLLGTAGCQARPITTPVCEQVVTGITAPVSPLKIEYGVLPAFTIPAQFLDGHSEIKNISSTVNVNQIGEQDISLVLSNIYLTTAKNKSQSITVPAKAIIYKVCQVCGSRYISSSCLVCRCNTIQTRSSAVSRYSTRLAGVKSNTVVIKNNVVSMQNTYLQ